MRSQGRVRRPRHPADRHLVRLAVDDIAWSSALDFNFPLLSDWNREATRAFGLEHTFRGFEGVSQRSAFLIGADGTVRGAWLYEITEVPDLDAVLSAARALPLSPASS